MTSISKPIVFFGTEDFSLIALKALVTAGYPVVAVVTKPDSAKGRGQQVIAPAVKTFALENNIAVWQPDKLIKITENVQKLDRPVGVLVSYGKIIPQSILDLFTPGIINLHPSLLPKYRGPSPIEATILNGDTETGVSIMQLSAKMDAGPIYAQERLSISEHAKADYLYNQLGFIGSKLLLKILPAIIDGSLQPEMQNDALATYCNLIKKSDGIIDWNKTSQEIEREIRAYKDWPQSRTKLGNIDVIITSATDIWPIKNSIPASLDIVYDEDVKTLFVGTANGSIEIDSIKPVGKKEMPIAAFLSGYRSQLGV